jgi:hypothetical protein
MGNFHCVPSGCAEVVYKEYLPPVVRWQYPGEAWLEIIGADNYSLENIVPNFTGGQCPKDYYVWCKWDGQRKIGRLIQGKITSVECSIYPDFLGRPRNYGISVKNDQGIHAYGSNFNTVVQNLNSNQIEIVPNVGLDDCGDKPSKCIFKVFKNGNIVHQEIRSICPQVQQLPCRLSDQVKSIEIEKLRYLERVEVIDWDYETVIGGVPLPVISVKRAEIPHHCLNIYKNSTTELIPPPGITIPSQSINAHQGYITQICSVPGCPPPEYGVICDDECNECSNCPPGTHPITCSDAVCCYDSSGKSVLEIAQFDYCGGDSCCE